MITEEQKKLCEESARLMGYPRHESGQEWPTLPFYGVDQDGITFIRWNDRDIAFIERRKIQGLVDYDEISDTWIPTHRIEQAMNLWRKYPPPSQWLELKIGKDGWIVTLLYHLPFYGEQSLYITDDDKAPSLEEAITQAWVNAMTHK